MSTQSKQKSIITGREPRLSAGYRRQGRWQLSLRGVATMLNALPPESISLDAVAAALHNKEYFVRYNAAKLLSRRADRDARIIMEEALSNGNAPTRASTARFLYGFSWYAAEPLINKALNDSDSRVREATIYALCDYRQLTAYQLMEKVLQNEEDNVRAAAVWGLREHRDPAAIPVLEATLLAEDAEVRVKAMETLALTDLPHAVPVVRKGVEDPDPEVKYAATLSWLELTEEKCISDLAETICTVGGADRAAILRGFFHATNYLKIDLTKESLLNPTLKAIEVAFNDEVPQARMAAAWPIAWIRHQRASDLLKQAYHKEQNPTVKAHILYVAFNLLSDVGQELLADAINSQLPEVKQMAANIQQGLSDGSVARVYTNIVH